MGTDDPRPRKSARTDAIKSAAEDGTSFGASSEKEIELAKLVKKFVPSIEVVRMVNSGTESTMSGMRLARDLRAATRSSSSKAVITATEIRF